MDNNKTHEVWMQEAINCALIAQEKGEVPVGAIVVKDNQIIATAYNQPISSQDPTAHAEIIALRQAGQKLGNYRLANTTLYATLEPCAMCAGAMIHARVETIVFGAYDHKTGACGTIDNLPHSKLSNQRPKIIGGILEKKCASLLKDFFSNKRNQG